jgi:hypothetical protein
VPNHLRHLNRRYYPWIFPWGKEIREAQRRVQFCLSGIGDATNNLEAKEE